MIKRLNQWIAALVLLFASGCTAAPVSEPATNPETTAEPVAEEAPQESEQAKPGDIEILYTSDTHCGVRTGFGMEGLYQIRDTLEKKGVTTLLVDDGDAIQGDVIGTLTKGNAIIRLMNELQYDVAIPGNHEFDYGTENFLELTESADFPYLSCNFTHDGELVFEPYLIKEAAGKKIAFIGLTTPKTLTSSSPSHFQDETGEFRYGFLQSQDGMKLFAAVQKYVDEVREKGADYVILMCHLGNEEANLPYTYWNLIEHTSGIDVLLDGHSHDIEQDIVKDSEGNDVVRSACGSKFESVGYVRISAEDGTITTGLYSWTDPVSASELLGIENQLTEPINRELKELDEIMGTVVGHSDVTLYTNDPTLRQTNGKPVRIVRSRETNLGDLITDAIRSETNAEVALLNSGGIRTGIDAGDITYGSIIQALPSSNQICVSEVTGQTLLDALEWGARAIPGDIGGFLQVSGLTYEIHADRTPLISVDDNSMFVSVDGAYRVSNVTVNGEPLDLEKTYRVAGIDFILKDGGSGFRMFRKEDVVLDEIKLDNQVLIDYISKQPNGTIGEEYADPYGQGRIQILGLD